LFGPYILNHRSWSLNQYCSNFAFVWSLHFENNYRFSTIKIFVSLNTLGLQYMFVVTVLGVMDIGFSWLMPTIYVSCSFTDRKIETFWVYRIWISWGICCFYRLIDCFMTWHFLCYCVYNKIKFPCFNSALICR